MAKIQRLKTNPDNSVQVTLDATQSELQLLKGCMENMHLFSEDNLNYTSRLVQRGRRESTKYFLLPKEHRNEVLPTTNVESTKLESKSKHIFIFAVNKLNI